MPAKVTQYIHPCRVVQRQLIYVFDFFDSELGTLVKLHGTFMVTAWMLAASCGMLVARYYKLTWVGKQIGGKDLWFAVSFICPKNV